jgi:multicomponent Na+:H+ antiporter subunit D
MLIGIGLGSVLGMQATLLHLFNHALMKGGLFLSIAAIVYRLGSSQLDALNGLGKRMPITSLSFTIGGLSLIGVPLTVGFISKWYLVSAAIESGRWPLAMLIVMGSLLALAYIWRVVERLYFKESEAGAPTGEAPLMMLIPLWLLISANVYFGIDTRLPIEITAEAARSLLEGAR